MHKREKKISKKTEEKREYERKIDVLHVRLELYSALPNEFGLEVCERSLQKLRHSLGNGTIDRPFLPPRSCDFL